jgi:hypothetical protein
MNELSRRIGKFDSPESLLEGYNELLREFTKRSQKLKAMEKELAAAKAEIADMSKYESFAQERIKDEQFVRTNILPDENIKEMIIGQYLAAIKSGFCPGVLTGGVGQIALSPSARPVSLQEAKHLAEIILKG